MGTKQVSEHVLYRVEGDARVPLFSDADLDVVQAHRVEEIRNAISSGRARPQLVITRRDCTYPLGKTGEPLAVGSTCDETDVHP